MTTAKQIEAIKYLILKSPHADVLAKRICFYLLDESAFLTRAVCISVIESPELPEDEARKAEIHDMLSSHCSTHLDAVMSVTGTDFIFKSHCGSYNDNHVFDPRPKGYAMTFWLSPVMYDHKALRIPFHADRINAIKLESKLYSIATVL